MPWLTPAAPTPTGAICRRLLIPDDPVIVMAVSGALLELTYERNWEQDGSATPEEMAMLMRAMVLDYLISECEEPVTNLTIQMGVFKVEIAQGQQLTAPGADQWFAVQPIVPLWNNVSVGEDGFGGIILPAGMYWIHAWHTLREANEARLSFWNKSTSTMLAVGESMDNGTGDDGQANIHVSTIFQSTYQVFDLRLWLGRTASNVLGQAADIAGMPEVYGQINIMKLDYEF